MEQVAQRQLRRRPAPAPVKVAPKTVRAANDLNVLRGYEREDLLVAAEIGHHYLMNGNVEIAQVVFEGLAAIAPREAYFSLALGLIAERSGRREEAHRFYARAAELDPRDGRADVNRAELYLANKDVERARAYFERGRAKADLKGDRALAKKAHAFLSWLAKGARR